jgi:hypothetical protein
MTWLGVFQFLGIWLLVALVAGILVGKAIRRADKIAEQDAEVDVAVNEWRTKDKTAISKRSLSKS